MLPSGTPLEDGMRVVVATAQATTTEQISRSSETHEIKQ